MSMLSQEEIDALVNQLSSPDADQSSLEGRKVKSFDFRFNKRLEKFQSNQLQTLRTLHDNVTRLLNNSLSVYLRTRVEATIVSIEQISYGDFIASLCISASVSCELKIGDAAGVMNFALPYSVLQSIGTQLADYQWSPSVVAGRGMTEEDIAQLARNVERAGVNLEVELGRTVVSLRDLVGLQLGDVVLFDKPVSEPLLMKVNDREKFRVYPGVNKDRVAVQIASVVEDEE